MYNTQLELQYIVRAVQYRVSAVNYTVRALKCILRAVYVVQSYSCKVRCRHCAVCT